MSRWRPGPILLLVALHVAAWALLSQASAAGAARGTEGRPPLAGRPDTTQGGGTLPAR